MAEPDQDFEAQLERLGQHLRRGQAKLRPLTQEELRLVQDAVRQQWEQEHGQTQAERKPEQPPQAQPIPKVQDQQQGPGKDQSHDYGHSH